MLLGISIDRMGTLSFQTPDPLPVPQAELTSHACMAGGIDRSPIPTHVELRGQQLLLRKDVEESGYLLVPWAVNGMGRLMEVSATLIERELPYHLQVELARGKINQVRTQSAEWRMLGLQTTPAFDQSLQEATHALGGAIMAIPDPEADQQSRIALEQSHAAGRTLMRLYTEQLFQARRQRQGGIHSFLSCRMQALPSSLADPLVQNAFNRVGVPMTWRQVEPHAGDFQWATIDALLAWAEQAGLPVIGGPLIDFSPAGLPDWLIGWPLDPSTLTSQICQYIDTTLQRYKKSIRRWVLCTASNSTDLPGLSEDDRLRLTAAMLEAAAQVDSSLELVIGIAQPWGEYMLREEHTYSPFVFADTLVRTGLPLAALELECFMGSWPRGSYCRDLIDTSRMFDLFALLGVPIQVAFSYPSNSIPDAMADLSQELSAGHWNRGFTEEVQADWAARFTALALSKPFVVGASWHQFDDAQPHLIPHGGLINPDGHVKPALQALRQMRQTFLS